MKKVLLILVCLSANSLFAQKTKRLNVPKVQETYQIDTLINHILSNGVAGKSCFLLEFYFPARIASNLDISAINTNLSCINLYMSDFTNLVYFDYKGFIVFMSGQSQHFFKRIGKSREFTFIRSFDPNNEKEKIKNKLLIDFCKYENKRFISIIGPVD